MPCERLSIHGGEHRVADKAVAALRRPFGGPGHALGLRVHYQAGRDRPLAPSMQ